MSNKIKFVISLFLLVGSKVDLNLYVSLKFSGFISKFNLYIFAFILFLSIFRYTIALDDKRKGRMDDRTNLRSQPCSYRYTRT